MVVVAVLMSSMARPAPYDPGKDGKKAYILGCVVARTLMGLQVCEELFEKSDARMAKLSEDERKMAHDAANMELAARKTDTRTFKNCPAERPLCQFPRTTVEGIRDNTRPGK
jgi:hypothetical protein